VIKEQFGAKQTKPNARSWAWLEKTRKQLRGNGPNIGN